MARKQKLNIKKFADEIVKEVNNPERLQIKDGLGYPSLQKLGLFLKNKQLGLVFDAYKKAKYYNSHKIAKAIVDDFINPLSEEHPDIYDAGVDWLENNIDLLGDEREYWKKRIKVLRDNSNSPKVG